MFQPSASIVRTGACAMCNPNDKIIATGNTVLIVVGSVDTGSFASALATIN